MNKHLQQKQIFDSFFTDEDLPMPSEDEPCLDPECINNEQIYEIIDHNGYEDISMNELELDDYDDFIQLYHKKFTSINEPSFKKKSDHNDM